MSNEKNTQPAEKKKERTSVLEKIRRRTGLLVGIVGLALVIFILESLLGSGASIFGGDEMSSAGRINGKKIERNDFLIRLENQLNNFRARNQGREVDDASRQQAIENIWQQYVVEYVLKPQFNKIGITVGEDELYETVVVNPVQTIIQNLTDQNTGKVNEQFSRPDGTLDPFKWRQAVQNVTGENEAAVRQMEEQVKSTRYFEKFRALVTNGLYVTKAEAKAAFKAQNDRFNVSFVMKEYVTIPDSSLKLTQDELEKYYKEHTYEYKNPETTRKVEYVTFNVLPSAQDMAAIEKEANRVASELKGKSLREDSNIMMQENEDGRPIVRNYNKKSMVIRDSSVFTGAPGTVYGPYNEGAYFKIYKLEAINQVADSARVRHILVGLNDPKSNQQKRTLAMAKKEADSLIVLLKTGRANFDSLVVNFSDDMGSKNNGGDYGWFGEDKGFVEPFKNAGLMGTKGNISAVETEFGYHIIEVLDVSKTKHNSYRVAEVMKKIGPSEETTQKMFLKANQFAGENNNSELFDKAVEKEKMTKRLADNLKEGDYQVPGLDNAKEMVRWAYAANKGDVSIFTFPERFVVAKLAGIKNKGILPLEEVKEEVTIKARKQKKADMIMAEFNTKAGGSNDLNQIASKMGLKVNKQESLQYAIANVETVGREIIFTGTVAGLKTGGTSKVTAGEAGVFVVTLNSIGSDPLPADFKNQQLEAERNLGGRADYEVFTALKDAADIEFHKSRID
jgi:peptidyl-prolyl cis-trans isomerase D